MEIFNDDRKRLLDRVVRKYPRDSIRKVLAGDWNANIAELPEDVACQHAKFGTVGKYCLPRTPAEEPYIDNVDFGRSRNLCIPDTHFPVYKRGTFYVPAGKYFRELDFGKIIS